MKIKLGYEVQKTILFEKLVKDLSKNFRSIGFDIDVSPTQTSNIEVNRSI